MEILELFRYRCSKKVFTTLLEFPKREFTLRELAKESEVPFSSARRIVALWSAAGIVEVGKLGKSKVIRFHKSPFTASISKMLKISLSPQNFTVNKLKTIIQKEKGIKTAYLFGSTARNEETLGSDIDLALHSDKGFDPDKIIFDIARKYGTKVVPILFGNRKESDVFLKGKDKVKLK